MNLGPFLTVEEPCQLGCSGLSYCTNFNNRPTEHFRSCTIEADQAASNDILLWQKGTIQLPNLNIPVKGMYSRTFYQLHTVNSDFFQGFYFRETSCMRGKKSSQNGNITHPFTVAGISCFSRESSNAIPENKILMKIFEFTLNPLLVKIFQYSNHHHHQQ